MNTEYRDAYIDALVEFRGGTMVPRPAVREYFCGLVTLKMIDSAGVNAPPAVRKSGVDYYPVDKFVVWLKKYFDEHPVDWQVKLYPHFQEPPPQRKKKWHSYDD